MNQTMMKVTHLRDLSPIILRVLFAYPLQHQILFPSPVAHSQLVV